MLSQLKNIFQNLYGLENKHTVIFDNCHAKFSYDELRQRTQDYIWLAVNNKKHNKYTYECSRLQFNMSYQKYGFKNPFCNTHIICNNNLPIYVWDLLLVCLFQIPLAEPLQIENLDREQNKTCLAFSLFISD